MAPWRRDEAAGRWTGMLPQLGISASLLTGKHVACPLCADGGGRDRFRYDDKEGQGTWICSRCGAGDGIALAMGKNAWTFPEAVERVRALIGTVERAQPKRIADAEKRKADLNALWGATDAMCSASPAGRYLFARIGIKEYPADLRSIERMRYQDDKPSWHPGFVAMVTGPNGKPNTLHRTYLSLDGSKAAVPEPRRLMPGNLAKGSAVRLFPVADEMGVAEGIETALSASALFGFPCWAAINANNLAAFVPPEDARRVIVFGDNDTSFTGQEAAFALAKRLKTSGLSTEVRIPDRPGTDWNDVLLND